MPAALSSNPSIKKTSGIEDRIYTKSKEPVKPVVGLRGDPNVTWRLVDHSHGSMALFITTHGVVVFHCRSSYERIRF